MIKVFKIHTIIDSVGEKLLPAKDCNLVFKNEDEMDIYRDCLEAEYLDEVGHEKLKVTFEFVEYE